MTKATLLAMSCGLSLGLGACTTSKPAALGDAALVDRSRPAPREGMIPMREAQPVQLDRQARQEIENLILDALDARWHSSVTPFRFGLYEDDRKHLVAFVVYDYSPLDAWEGRMSDDVHSQELERIDAQIAQCEDALSKQGQAATNEQYDACVTQAYPQELRPFVSEGSGRFCTELRMARFELGPMSAQGDKSSTMREVHDVLLRSPVCEVMTVSELAQGDYDADGFVELSFTVEANMYRERPHSDEEALQAQFAFVFDASRGALQWSEILSGERRFTAGRYRLVSPGKSSDKGPKRAAEIELERFALNADSPGDSLICYEELFDQLKKSSAWIKELQLPGGCVAVSTKSRYRYTRALDRWELVSKTR